ncbi:hypothetical protein ACXR2T_08105 [Leucobacter sp. HY1910]
MIFPTVKAATWVSGAATAATIGLHFAPEFASFVDERIDGADAASFASTLDPLFPWAYASPVVFAGCLGAWAWLHRRAKQGAEEEVQRHRSNFREVAHERPDAFDGIVAAGALEADPVTGEVPGPEHITATSIPAAAFAPVPAQVEAEPAPVSETEPAEEAQPATAEESETEPETDPTIVPVAKPVSPEEAPVADPLPTVDTAADSAQLEEARAFLADRITVTDLELWVNELVQQVSGPFEEAASAGSFDVGIGPTSVRVLYTKILLDRVAGLHEDAAALAAAEGVEAEVIALLTERR